MNGQKHIQKRDLMFYASLCKICEFATNHFYEKTKNIINLNDFWNDTHCNNNFVKNF